MEISDPVCFFTPSKINFFLYIQKQRPDGYHEVSLDLLPVSLFDKIELFPGSAQNIEFESNLSQVKPEDNLAVKAVRLLESKINERINLKIKLSKNVPVGAGLGGGSANAAGILTALNHFLDLGFSVERLKEMALSLGADVPFFIEAKPCHAKGAGEELLLLPGFPHIYLVLIFPGFPVSTAEAYNHCNISGSKAVITDYSPQGLASLTPEMNDFWPYLSGKYPVLTRIKKNIIQAGALSAGLSGSGSSMFGVFADRESRDRALSILAPERGQQIFSCRTLSRHNYFGDYSNNSK